MHEALLTKSYIRRDGVAAPASSRKLQIQPSPATSSPTTAVERRLDDVCRGVAQAIASLGYHPLSEVTCEAAADRIVLSGRLPSYHLKQLAQTAALQVAGPGCVDNRVKVTSR